MSFPTPVFSNELAGGIPARDIGDARRTRHFYTFRGMEGDVSVVVESADLIGDVDVFTANTLRPLLKFTLFGSGATKAAKSFYLRKEEILVLRVEARAAGDTDGTYSIHFGGSFAPAPGDLTQSPVPAAPSIKGLEQGGAGVRRVTSTGARIESPIAPSTAKESASAITLSEGSEAPPDVVRVKKGQPDKKESARVKASRGARGTTARNHGARPAPPEPSTPPESSDKENAAATPHPKEVTTPENATANTSTARTVRTTRSRGSRTPKKSSTATGRSEPTATAEAPTVVPQIPPGPRLIIITKSGNIFQRDMNTVRRVTVENNQVVILMSDGKVVRQPLANVLRMSIEP